MKRRAILLLLGAVIPIFAQQDAQPPEDDGPGRGVARLSVMNGEVSIRRGDSGDFVAAALNAPLVVTDRVVTGPQSRAELQFDWANMIRIGSNAEVRLSELDNRRYQIQIAIGTTTFRVLRSSNADVEISTPSVSVRPLGISVIRVMVREDGSSEITVRSGEAEIFTPRGSERLRGGTTMLARGSVQEPEFQEVAAIPFDDWDRWNVDRDRDLERSHSYQYVSPEISGAEDLEGHGRWVNAEGYGNVWAPAVDAGWAPYRYGRWVWEDYYGWTWVSYDPWGWAPYHYGRWFNSPVYGWCWWPGGIHERHYWRPALVAFFGWGSYGGFRTGVGFGWGNVGWVPLAPHEIFHPWYGRGFYGGYRGSTVLNATVINNTNITNVYRNARVHNGITAVNTEVFGRRGITNADLVRVNGSQLQNAGLVRGVLPVTPARESLRLADRNSAVSSRASETRSFFTRQPARSVDRVSFEQQRQGMEQAARRTFGDTSGLSGSRVGAGSGATAGTGSGWRRAGEGAMGSPATGSGQPAGNSSYRGTQTQEQQGGWHRFGDPSPHLGAAGSAAATGAAANSLNPAKVPAEAAAGSRQQDNGWRRFGESSTAGRNTATAPNQIAPSYRSAPAPAATDSSWGRGGTQFRSNGYGDSSAGSYGAGSQDRSQAVRINPSMVRERPSSSAPAYGSGGGSRPQYSAAPPASRTSAPAPRSSGGGGGGGSSHSSGSGGGGRSGGGSSSGGRGR